MIKLTLFGGVFLEVIETKRTIKAKNQERGWGWGGITSNRQEGSSEVIKS